MKDVMSAGDVHTNQFSRAKPLLIQGFDFLPTGREGVVKLRELILMLAMRGNLGCDDPTDPSAEDLLAKVKSEKDRLVSSGRIKRDKPLPVIDAADVPWPVPIRWIWVRLVELGQIVGGGTPKSDEPAMWSPPVVPWLTPADLYGLADKHISRGRRNISEVGLASSSAQRLPAGTVLFSSRAPIGYVAITADSLATNQGFKSCVPHLPALADYLYWFLKHSARAIDAAASGTTFKEISGGEFAKVLVPFPPLAEQHRIVARVEELMKLCDRLEENGRLADEQHARLVSALFNALEASESSHSLRVNWRRVAEHFDLLLDRPEAIDGLERTLISLAVQGRLAPQDASEEPARIALQRVRGARAALILDRRIRQLDDIEHSSLENAIELPPGWVSVQVNDVAIVQGGKRLPKGAVFSESPTPHTYIRVTDMKNGSIADTGLKFISPAVHREIARYVINSDDLYITIAGTIGHVGSVPASLDGQNLTENAAKIVFRGFDRDFFQLVLTSEYLQAQFSEKTNQMAQPKLALKRIAGARFNFPPLAEQHRIVARVEALRRLCAELRGKLTAARGVQAALAGALVEAAVR